MAASLQRELLVKGNVSDPKVLKKVEEILKQDAGVEAAIFRALGDPLRLQILRALEVSELCVCILVALTKYNYSALSHHLKLLKDAGLVDVRRDGNFLIYSLTGKGRKALIRLK